MSDKLLPPKVQGPITVLNAAVTVVGACAGATVALYQDGTDLKLPTIADQSGTAVVVLGKLTLTATSKLTAKQSDGNVTSDAGPAETVMNAPVQIPPLAFLSLVHEYMDAVVVGGAIPYALIELYDQGQVVGLTGADGTVASLPYQQPGAIKQGMPLAARQVITWQGQSLPGPMTPSLNVQPNPLQDRMMPAPSISEQLSQCETSVPVVGIVDGATLHLYRSNFIDNYVFLGNGINAQIANPLWAGEQVSVNQAFDRVSLPGPQSSPPTPVLATVPQAPRIQSPVCVDSPQITISNLRPGCTVLLYSGRKLGNTIEQEGPWKATASAGVQPFPLPANLQGNMSGPPEFLFVYQEDCKGQRSGLDSPPYVPLIKLSNAPPPPMFGPLFECARLVDVTNLEPGTSVALTSDQPDWPVLAAPTVAYGSAVDIQLYRPLRAGEVVTASVSPCGSGQGNASTVAVQPLQALNRPVVHDPTRAWQTSVLVEKCVPGARVHVFVNNVWRGSADAATDRVWVPVGSLLQGGKVKAQQCLCTLISGPSDPEVTITFGEATFSQTPAPLVTSPYPQSVTIFAHDVDDNHLVDGQILTWPGKQSVGKTNQPLTKLFPYFYNPLSEDFTMQAPGYLPNNILHFSVIDPKPTANFTFAPKQPYENQVVYFTDLSVGPITSREWDFDLGKAKSTVKNPTFKFWSFGNYKVTLTVKSPGGQDAKTTAISIGLPPSNPPPAQGFDAVQFYFCPAAINFPQPGAHSTLYIYVADLTVSKNYAQPKVLQQGYVGGTQNFAGVCGAGQGSGSETVQLTDKHQYHIVGVDPDLCNGQNDPGNGACVAWEGYFTGKQGGGTVIIEVN